MRTVTEEEYNRGFITGQGTVIGNQEIEREPITFTVSDANGITRFLDVIQLDDLVSSSEGLNPAGVETTVNEVSSGSQEKAWVVGENQTAITELRARDSLEIVAIDIDG
ncbi:hypothetical protein BOTCAL_0428g00070 [Botryotinia calthae]|uniref:Uncharacterized protein n=1 Tax=Botryotinia calthae TaxID=38488 RepID=A0A4Y8CNX6_9HELO|nr:hypothetical protein BOTCAL_0428g00070 [Botryotinia calthae]